MKSLPVTIAAVLLMVSASAASAPIYKWQDDQGRLYFSDQPPKNVIGAEQTQLQTKIPGDSGTYSDHPYSIQKQVEFLQAQQEKRQQMRLDELAARQSMQAAARQQSQMVMPPLDGGIPAIVPLPRYQPLYYRTPRYYGRYPGYGYRPGYSGSSLGYIHQGDHHRFSLNMGFYNRLSPGLYNRLRYRNFR